MSGSRSTPPAMDDLERIARAPGASKIEDIDEPGGGKRVRLVDPDGYQVEVVHGMQMLDPIPVHRPRVNSGDDKYRRKGELFRVDPRPVAHQAARPFRGDEQEFREDARLVSRDAGLPLLGRILCRRPEQRGRLVQPARPRRRLRRPSRLLLHSRRQERAQPSVLRGRRHRRRDDRPRASRKARAISTCGASAAI